MQNAVRVGVACFVWKDNKFLVQQRIGSHGHNTWSLPGGHMEFGESWEDCAKREVREESGLEISNVRFLAVTNDIFSENKHYVTIWMEADWQSGQNTITEPSRCAAQSWCDFHSLPSPLFAPCWNNLRVAKPKLFN